MELNQKQFLVVATDTVLKFCADMVMDEGDGSCGLTYEYKFKDKSFLDV